MIWAVMAAGLILAILGATAGSALVATSRAELARFATAQLRGGRSEGLGLGQLERLLVAAASTTSLGVLLLGAALVGLLVSVTTGRLPIIALLLLIGVPVVLVGGYLVPRWLAWRRPEGALRWTLPFLRPWSNALGLFLPSDGPGEESR